jgi:hypothetical protein
MELKMNIGKMIEDLPNIPGGIIFTIGDVTFRLEDAMPLGPDTMNNIKTEEFEGHADIISEPKETNTKSITTEIHWAFKASDGDRKSVV